MTRLIHFLLAIALGTGAVYAQSAAPMPYTKIQFFDNNGAALAGGKVCSYAAGTTTPQATYTDSTAGTPNTNPVILDSAGRGAIWLGAYSYKIALLTPGTDNTCNTGTTLWTQDNVSDLALLMKSGGLSFLGGAITGSPTSAVLRDFKSLKDYGAYCDGAHATADTAAFNSALSSGANILIPNGTCNLVNTSGTISTAFSGKIYGWGPSSVLSCTSLSYSCLTFANTTGLVLNDFTITFSTTPGVRNGAQALVINTSSYVTLRNLYIHDGPSSALNMNSNSHVQIDGLTMANMWANGALMVNNSDLSMVNISSTYAQDAAVEFSKYDNQTGSCARTTLSNFTSYHDFTGWFVNGCQDVAISNFSIRDTYLDAAGIWQDSATTTTSWPDRVTVSNGVIYNTGSQNPANSAVRGLHLLAPSTTPTIPQMHIALSDIKIVGGNTGANSVQIEASNYYTVSLSHITVENSGFESFDIAGQDITATDLESRHSQSYAYVFRTNLLFTGSNILANDSQEGGADNRAFLDVVPGSLAIFGLKSEAEGSPARNTFDLESNTGYHAIFGASFTCTYSGVTCNSFTNGSTNTQYMVGNYIVNGVPGAPLAWTLTQLPSTAAAGTLMNCSDCKNSVDDAAVVGAACSGSGHGALAVRLNGAWRCY